MNWGEYATSVVFLAIGRHCIPPPPKVLSPTPKRSFCIKLTHLSFSPISLRPSLPALCPAVNFVSCTRARAYAQALQHARLDKVERGNSLVRIVRFVGRLTQKLKYAALYLQQPKRQPRNCYITKINFNWQR